MTVADVDVEGVRAVGGTGERVGGLGKWVLS